METKEYFFTEKLSGRTKRQLILDIAVWIVRILMIVEGFGYILFREYHLNTVQLVLCLAYQLVYDFMQKEYYEIIIDSVFQMNKEGLFLKRTSLSEQKKETILSIPWHAIINVSVSEKYIRIDLRR